MSEQVATLGQEVKTVDIMRIMQLIPHRYPFLLIDRVEEMFGDESGIGVKNVTINEPFFQGHFPDQPVMPGVLIVEAMAQTAAVLVVEYLGGPEAYSKLVYFMTIENARFRKPVLPGSTLKVHVEKVRHRANVWKYRGSAQVDGLVMAEATFSAMIVRE